MRPCARSTIRYWSPGNYFRAQSVVAMKAGWPPDAVLFLAALSALASLAVSSSNAADLSLLPGLYQVEVRISLPNVAVAAPLLLANRCITPDDLKSGQAFFVLSDNPLQRCDLVDYQTTATAALYRIVCAGPNRGSAVAVFDTRQNTYQGTIRMNMGGKNMTMSETQTGKRIGDCR